MTWEIGNTPPELYRLLLDLVRVPSVSLTPGEVEIADRIEESLRALPYFRRNPQDLGFIPIPGDKIGRKSVMALVRAEPATRRTVLVIGHADVVGPEPYGELADLAFDPVALTARMKGEELSPEVRADLESGDFIFGRGTGDMKAGVALGMGLVAERSADVSSMGANLLFLALVDEEISSAGMRAAVPVLAGLQEELDFVACLNTEPSDPGFSQGRNHCFSLGSAGKHNLFFLFAGRASHSTAYFEGFNAVLPAAHLAVLLEGNDSLTDRSPRDTFSPMGCLKLKDLRNTYSGTLPETAAAYVNLNPVHRMPGEILKVLGRFSAEALDRSIRQVRDAYLRYGENIGQWPPRGEWQGKVLPFSELRQTASRRVGPAYEGIMKAFAEGLPPGMEEQDRCIAVAEETLRRSGVEGPLVVYGFLPPYYPQRVTTGRTGAERNLLGAVDWAVREGRERHGVAIDVNDYFGGVSDLSFLGFQGTREDMEALSGNLPGWGTVFSIPVEALSRLDVPVANIAPAGKDSHRKTERLEIRYSLEVVPRLLGGLFDRLAREH
ncbi:MAG: M20/M25/M40 family metallo-hydrolase [Synergistales bacterium]